MNFSDFFEIPNSQVEGYGAFDISLDSDLPLFIDPFLLFNSDKPEYAALHESILAYLTFLRDKALLGPVDDGLLRAWYCFKEVKQNWFGFTILGNDGHGLGMDFARSLSSNLGLLFSDPAEPISTSKHLEKVTLIRGGVGRDNISDFVTSLIKEYLLKFTEEFARNYLAADKRQRFRVRRVAFNYRTESWQDGTYELPALTDREFVLLTPSDMLTKDDTWINRSDLVHGFFAIPTAIGDEALRAQVSNYFEQALARRPDIRKAPTQRDRVAAVDATIREFPVVLDYYIALKEIEGDRATALSQARVDLTRAVFYDQLHSLIEDLTSLRGFYRGPVTSYEEALLKVHAFKNYIENNDGYRLINPGARPFGSEKDVQLFFGLALIETTFDVNREPNNGRGPVDYKLSRGAYDKSLIEFKLGSNTQLKRNLQNQTPIYEAANRTDQTVKVIVNYTIADERRVQRILRELGVQGAQNIVVVDARADNKPSGSRA